MVHVAFDFSHILFWGSSNVIQVDTLNKKNRYLKIVYQFNYTSLPLNEVFIHIYGGARNQSRFHER